MRRKISYKEIMNFGNFVELEKEIKTKLGSKQKIFDFIIYLIVSEKITITALVNELERIYVTSIDDLNSFNSEIVSSYSSMMESTLPKRFSKDMDSDKVTFDLCRFILLSQHRLPQKYLIEKFFSKYVNSTQLKSAYVALTSRGVVIDTAIISKWTELENEKEKRISKKENSIKEKRSSTKN